MRSPTAMPAVISTCEPCSTPVVTSTRSTLPSAPTRNTKIPSSRTTNASRSTSTTARGALCGSARRTGSPIGQCCEISTRTSIMRERSSPTGTTVRMRPVARCASASSATFSPPRTNAATASGAWARTSIWRMSTSRTSSPPTATDSPGWRRRSTTRPPNGARTTLRSRRCAARSRATAASVRSCCAISRRASASSSCVPDTSPWLDSDFCRSNCCSASLAAVVSRASEASVWASVSLSSA